MSNSILSGLELDRQPTKQARVDGAQDSSQERVTRRISRLLDLIYKLYASSSRSEPAGETMEASSSVPQVCTHVQTDALRYRWAHGRLFACSRWQCINSHRRNAVASLRRLTAVLVSPREGLSVLLLSTPSGD